MSGLNKAKEYLIPKWKVGDPNGLEQYITELKGAKAMNITQNDKMLIYASMVKSEKSEILESLTDEQKEDLDQFVTFLRDSFGPTGQEQRFQFQDLKQQADENETNYFFEMRKNLF